MSDKGLIGDNNQLPWHLPADLAWFKKNTLKKPVIMGRKTWESLPIRPLPGRTNIVVSRNPGYQPRNTDNIQLENVIVTASLTDAIGKCREYSQSDEAMVIGGAMLYEEAMPRADRLYITCIEGDFSGDAWFPEIDYTKWRETFRESHGPDEKNGYRYRFMIFERT